MPKTTSKALLHAAILAGGADSKLYWPALKPARSMVNHPGPTEFARIPPGGWTTTRRRSRPPHDDRHRRTARAAARVVGLSLLLMALAVSGPGAEDQDTTEDTETALGHDLSPKFSLHGFGDVSLGAERVTGDAEKDTFTGFGIGALDLFLVSKPADNLSFLGEIAFEHDDDGGSFVDLERLSLKYTFSDSFWAALGRHHAALGYWNETYHHGFVLQPTVHRPAILDFEDDGGLLPIHTVGLALGGRVFRGRWGVDYEGNLGNGRGIMADDVQNVSDVDDRKSFTTRVTFIRDGDSQILFGPMAHFDKIPPDPDTPARDGTIDEQILGGHLVYRGLGIEVTAEYYDIRHDDSVSGQRFRHDGYFIIGIRQSGQWRPYAGYDLLDVEDSDPYYAGLTTDVKRWIAGLRVDLNPFTAFKVEYRNEHPPGGDLHALEIQAGFIF